MTSNPSETDAARRALDGVASLGPRPSYGPAKDWAYRVAMMDPPEIFHRTASAPEETSIAVRRNALLDQVDGARAAYESSRAGAAQFAKEFPSYGQEARPADGARQATGGRVEKPGGGSRGMG